MVATEILDEALRGGRSALALLERTEQRLASADAALRDALPGASSYIAETKTCHSDLRSSSTALNTELDMLAASLDEITATSQSIAQSAQETAEKCAYLDELAAALPPFVQVAEALHLSDGIEDKNFVELQHTLGVLQSAMSVASISERPLLLQTISDLEERAGDTVAMMTARYMDLFSVKSNSVSARILESSDPNSSFSVGAASESLAKAGLLSDAIKGIVTEIFRNDIATGLRAATVFFESSDDGSSSLEWSVGDASGSELLEFNFDDLEHSSESDIDAMSECLDIANAGSRALRVFEFFREKVVGSEHCGELAMALQSWFADKILPASGVVTSLRLQYRESGVPRDALRARAVATTATARVVETAIRARGASQFSLKLDTEAIEQAVGAECRAEALLAARRAIGTFAEAIADSSQIIPCPISSPAFVPRERRTPNYFASCLISQSAATVLSIFEATSADAREALAGGSTGIASALTGAAMELLRAYLHDIPVQHGEDLRSSLRLKALYYNDCMTLAHACRLSIARQGELAREELKSVIESLERAAQGEMMSVRQTAEQRLNDNLKVACRSGALGAYGTLTRIQRGSALTAAVAAMEEVVSVFADIVPTELAELAAATLCDKYLSILCHEVLSLSEISAEGCEQIDNILAEADANVSRLMNLVSGMEVLRQGAPPPPPVERLGRTRAKVEAYREVLNGRMQDITTFFREGRYEGLISRGAMEHFLIAIFEDTPLRANAIRDLDTPLEDENATWANSNW